MPEPPVPVMPSTGVCRAAAACCELGAQVVAEVAGLGRGDRPGHGRPLTGDDRRRRGRALVPQVGVAGRHDLVDHARQAEPLAVLGAEDGDAGGAQPLDLGRHDDAAAAADDLDVAGARLAQQLHEVLEVLDVPALVRADGDALHVLLDGGVDDLAHAAVVPEVDDLGPLGLHDPPHDVDRRVVPVEQGGRGDDAHRVLGHVQVGRRGGRLRCHGGPFRGVLPILGRPTTYSEVTSTHLDFLARCQNFHLRSTTFPVRWSRLSLRARKLRRGQRVTADAYGSGAAASTSHSGTVRRNGSSTRLTGTSACSRRHDSARCRHEMRSASVSSSRSVARSHRSVHGSR